jgi:hypothetical protein
MAEETPSCRRGPGTIADSLSNLPWSEMRIPLPISVELSVKRVAE